jgi:hypothetical protein
MNDEPLVPLRLDYKAAPLPPDEAAPQIGEALAAGLRQALSEGRTFRLRRRESGLFRAENVDYGAPLSASDDAELLEALAGTVARAHSEQEVREAGIPVGPAECAAAGELLLRLWHEAARIGVWMSLDYRAALEPHLRYRLVFRGAGQSAWRYLRADSLAGVLVEGITFLATNPKVL